VAEQENTIHAVKHKLMGSKEIPIMQSDLNGNMITEHGSMKKASVNTGVNHGHICEVVNFNRNQAGGYLWKRK